MKVSNWLLSHCCPSAPESSGCSPTADSKGFEYVCASLSSLGFFVFVHAENSSSDQRQACKKHELYVSFRDLGWQVRMAELPHIGPFSVSASHRDVSMVPCVTVHVFSPSGLESSVSQAGIELTG